MHFMQFNVSLSQLYGYALFITKRKDVGIENWV